MTDIFLIIILSLCLICFVFILNIYVFKKEEKNIVPEKNQEINLSLYLDNTDHLLNLIDTMTKNEIDIFLTKIYSLGKEYESFNIDNDAKEISTKIYGLIRPDVIKSNQTVLTEDAIMTYIINRTVLLFIHASLK